MNTLVFTVNTHRLYNCVSKRGNVEELEASIEESEERHEKAVPILTRVVDEMHTLEPKEQNDLLKMIVDRIEYEKTESGAAIEPTLRISLKI